MASKKPKARRRGPRGTTLLVVVDRYLVFVTAGGIAFIYLLADILGFVLSQGTHAALASTLGYALLKMKTDSRWRELEEAEGERLALGEGATPSVAPAPVTPKASAKEGAAS